MTASKADRAKLATRVFKAKLRRVVDEIKTAPCVDCGAKLPPHCMEFDHLADKTLSVSAMVARHWSAERIKVEIGKCELVCVLCHRNRTHNRQPHRGSSKQSVARARGREFVNGLKREPCVDCGGRFNPWQMDYDHKPGTIKVADVSKLVGCSEKHILAEIAKCELVCVVCHKMRTHGRYDYGSRKMRGESSREEIRQQRDEEISTRNDKIVELYKTSNAMAVSRAMGLSGPSIFYILRSRGIKTKGISEAKRYFTEKEDVQIAELYQYGFPAPEIQLMYSVGEGAVYSALDRMGVVRRTNVREIVDSDGIRYTTQHEAAKKTGIPRTSISGNLTGRLRQAGGLVFKYVESD